MQPKKVAFLISHPIQYFAPLLAALNKIPEIDFKVYYCSDHGVSQKIDKEFGRVVTWDTPILEGYAHEFIRNQSPNPSVTEFWGLVNFGIVGKLWTDKPDVLIVHGWGYFTHWLALLAASVLGIELWFRSEAPIAKENKRSWQVKLLRKLVFGQLLFKRISRFLYIGKSNKQFYEYFGVPEHKFVFTPYCIDNEKFTKAYENQKDQKDALRQGLGLSPQQKVFLFCGKLIEIKAPFVLLEAYKKIQHENTALVIVGDGKLRQDIANYITQEGLLNVKMVGFKNQSEIMAYYVLADVLLLTSVSETWGLVVNEAMNFRLACIVSSGVGCAADLVQDGQNGFIFENGNVQDLADKMRNLVENPNFLLKTAEIAPAIVSKYTVAESAKNVQAVLRQAIEK
jgi:glycosyltransferase involved in cell wall biosynthesis